MKYRIIERYERWTRKGKEFSKWFPVMSKPIADTKEALKDELKKCKEFSKELARKMKLKYEYDIEYFDNEEEDKFFQNILEREIAAQNRPKRPRGRPRKVTTEPPVTTEPKRRGRPKKVKE